MTSQYPAKIDDNITLPTAADNSSLVRAAAVNELRAALIAIESTLGINPASVYGTIRERLAAFETVLANISNGESIVALGGDLAGNAISQKVVGLQGNPISSDVPSDGYVLTWGSGVWEAQAIPSGFTAGGDLSGTSTSQTVNKVHGTTYPIGGSLTTGHVPSVSGSAAVTYDFLNNLNISSSAAIDYSKMGTGVQSIGAQQFDTTVDSKGTARDVQPKNVQTTNATVTTLDSFTIPSNTTLIISSAITAVKSDNSLGAAYLRTAAFRNNAGTVAQISTTQDGGTFEDDASWDATIDNSTTTIRIRVTGKAATTIRWTCISTRLEVIS